MTDPLDHPTSQYAIDVVEDRIVAAPLVKAQCARHLRDLETGDARGLWFDVDAANRFFNFAGMFNHTTGKFAGKPIELLSWQHFVFGAIYGWKYEESGLRRFRTAYNQVAKKNGKTTMAALPAHYGLTLDREGSPQVYAAATSRDQAGLLFREAKVQAANSEIAALLVINQHEILCPATNGVMKCLTREPGSADGINPHVAVGDEVHRWRTGELGEIIKNSMINRDQPLYWMITTAGSSPQSYCGEIRDYAEQVVTGALEDDSFFAFVTEPPADADISDERTWEMANPSIDAVVPRAELRRLHDEAKAIPGRLPAFKRFHCNQFTDGAESWIDAQVWSQGGEPFDLSFLDGRECYAALDLSSTIDLSALAYAFPMEDAVYLLVRSFLATGGRQGTIADRAKRDGADYVAWDGRWLEQHRHGAIDENRIFEQFKEDAERFDIRELAYDRWGMASMRERFTSMLGERFIMHGQGFASMSAPMKRFEQHAMVGTIRHGGNPVLARAIANTHRDSDPAGNIKPNKAKSLGRIDPAVAAIMAVGRADARKPRRRMTRFISI